MADKKITDLPGATILSGLALIEISSPGTPYVSEYASIGMFAKIFSQVDVGDETTPLTTGLKKTFRWWNTDIVQEINVEASLTSPQTTGGTLVTIDVKVNGTSIFTTKPTIDNNEKSTLSAATRPNVSGSAAIYSNDEVTIHVDAIQSGSAAAGLKVYIEGRYG